MSINFSVEKSVVTCLIQVSIFPAHFEMNNRILALEHNGQGSPKINGIIMGNSNLGHLKMLALIVCQTKVLYRLLLLLPLSRAIYNC